VLQYGRSDYGSDLRDASALVTLASEAARRGPSITGRSRRVEAARGITSYLSDPGGGLDWCWPPARSPRRSPARRSRWRARSGTHGLNRRFRPTDLQARSGVTNLSDGTLQAVVTVSARRWSPEPAGQRRA